MAKWSVETGPELIPVPVDQRQFNELLAEVAELLLSSYCQLRKNHKASEPVGTHPQQSSTQCCETERIDSK